MSILIIRKTEKYGNFSGFQVPAFLVRILTKDESRTAAAAPAARIQRTGSRLERGKTAGNAIMENSPGHILKNNFKIEEV